MRIAVMGSGGLGGFFGARLAVGRANTVGLPDDYADDRLGFIDTLHPEMMASMAHDLVNGNRLELPWLSGGVVGLGEGPACRLRSIAPCAMCLRSIPMAAGPADPLKQDG
jgi:ketopantoate reductase